MEGKSNGGPNLFHRNGFSEVPGLVHIAAAHHRDPVAKQLKGYHGEKGDQMIVHFWDLDRMVR